jgi:prepilin-type N-terminal cleavage/methylation domain-containing protein
MTRLRDSSGFSLVEVMVAALILLIGAGAAFSLIQSANRSVTSNSARVGATNLAREITEYARGTDYDLLQPSQLVTALRKHSAIGGTLSGGVWKIQRRNVTYTVSAEVCIFDDPKDGLAATPLANACPTPAAVAGAPTESNSDDFRRVTLTLSWNARNRSGTMKQSTLLVNPAGGLGPRITRFDQPATQNTGNSTVWGGVSTLRLTSTGAASVHWTADDGISGGNGSGGSTDWGFTWDFGTAFDTSNPWVRDGAYLVNAQAFDSRGVPGEARTVTIYVNRHAPAAPSGLEGGYNATRGVVDMHWSRYDERDLQGYRVVRVLDSKQICPASGSVQDALSCTDTNPLPLSAYAVYAVDCTDLAAATCVHRLGTPALTASITLIAGTAPDAPTGLTASIVDGKPTLSWTAPASVPNGPIRFYRIYRDTGTTLADRYDETVTNSPNYVDPKPGATTSHRYWVTAVDQNFNESPVSAYVDSPPVT